MQTLAAQPDRTARQDLLQLLEQNYREQRPLLDGALLYRGTSVPVQEGGVVSDTVMHATLLPKIATEYTHNHGEGQVGFIGAYALSRDAVFHKDWGMEKSLNGQDTGGRTVAQAEGLLRPLVAELAAARDEPTRAQCRHNIEALIERDLYETALPLRTSGGRAVAAEQLFYYSGQPKAHSNKEALQGMSPVLEHNSAQAKEAVFNQYRGRTTNALRDLGRAPMEGAPSEVGMAAKALTRIAQVSQAEFSKELRQAYGQLPLQDLTKAAAEHPTSRPQAQLKALGEMLKDSLQSPDSRHQAMGQTAAKLIADLPQNATYREVCGAMGEAAKRMAPPASSAAASAAAPASKPEMPHSHGRDR